MGDSVGKWEGDTLVVDVTGFNDETWIDWAGYFHTNKMRVEERFLAARATSCTTRPSSTIPMDSPSPGRWTKW